MAAARLERRDELIEIAIELRERVGADGARVVAEAVGALEPSQRGAGACRGRLCAVRWTAPPHACVGQRLLDAPVEGEWTAARHVVSPVAAGEQIGEVRAPARGCRAGAGRRSCAWRS